MKNREKMVLKTMCFFDIDFSSFFSIFRDFGLILEAPEAQKISKKLNKSCSGRFWNALEISNRFWDQFWSDLPRFCMNFGRI